MDKPKLHELLTATNELAGIGSEAVRECAADFIRWTLNPVMRVIETVGKAQEWDNEFGQEVDEEVEQE